MFINQKFVKLFSSRFAETETAIESVKRTLSEELFDYTFDLFIDEFVEFVSELSVSKSQLFKKQINANEFLSAFDLRNIESYEKLTVAEALERFLNNIKKLFDSIVNLIDTDSLTSVESVDKNIDIDKSSPGESKLEQYREQEEEDLLIQPKAKKNKKRIFAADDSTADDFTADDFTADDFTADDFTLDFIEDNIRQLIGDFASSLNSIFLTLKDDVEEQKAEVSNLIIEFFANSQNQLSSLNQTNPKTVKSKKGKTVNLQHEIEISKNVRAWIFLDSLKSIEESIFNQEVLPYLQENFKPFATKEKFEKYFNSLDPEKFKLGTEDPEIKKLTKSLSGLKSPFINTVYKKALNDNSLSQIKEIKSSNKLIKSDLFNVNRRVNLNPTQIEKMKQILSEFPDRGDHFWPHIEGYLNSQNSESILNIAKTFNVEATVEAILNKVRDIQTQAQARPKSNVEEMNLIPNFGDYAALYLQATRNTVLNLQQIKKLDESNKSLTKIISTIKDTFNSEISRLYRTDNFKTSEIKELLLSKEQQERLKSTNFNRNTLKTIWLPEISKQCSSAASRFSNLSSSFGTKATYDEIFNLVFSNTIEFVDSKINSFNFKKNKNSQFENYLISSLKSSLKEIKSVDKLEGLKNELEAISESSGTEEGSIIDTLSSQDSEEETKLKQKIIDKLNEALKKVELELDPKTNAISKQIYYVFRSLNKQFVLNSDYSSAQDLVGVLNKQSENCISIATANQELPGANELSDFGIKIKEAANSIKKTITELESKKEDIDLESNYSKSRGVLIQLLNNPILEELKTKLKTKITEIDNSRHKPPQFQKGSIPDLVAKVRKILLRTEEKDLEETINFSKKYFDQTIDALEADDSDKVKYKKAFADLFTSDGPKDYVFPEYKAKVTLPTNLTFAEELESLEQIKTSWSEELNRLISKASIINNIKQAQSVKSQEQSLIEEFETEVRYINIEDYPELNKVETNKEKLEEIKTKIIDLISSIKAESKFEDFSNDLIILLKNIKSTDSTTAELVKIFEFEWKNVQRNFRKYPQSSFPTYKPSELYESKETTKSRPEIKDLTTKIINLSPSQKIEQLENNLSKLIGFLKRENVTYTLLYSILGEVQGEITYLDLPKSKYRGVFFEITNKIRKKLVDHLEQIQLESQKEQLPERTKRLIKDTVIRNLRLFLDNYNTTSASYQSRIILGSNNVPEFNFVRLRT